MGLSSLFTLFYFKKYLFTYCCVGTCSTQALSLQRAGFSLLWCAGSVVVAEGLVPPTTPTPCMGHLISPTRDRSQVPCSGRRILNHWTTQGNPPRWHLEGPFSTSCPDILRWLQSGCHDSVSPAASTNRRKQIISALCCLSAEKPFLVSLRSQPLPSHCLGLGHVLCATPIIG